MIDIGPRPETRRSARVMNDLYTGPGRTVSDFDNIFQIPSNTS